MGVYDDIAAAKLAISTLERQLTDAKVKLSTLQASAVVGGPDVSSFQGDVDWDKVKAAGYDIVFPKVSDGDLADPTYTAARIASIKSAGLSYAPYYFARVASSGNNERNGRSEAAMAVYFAERHGWGRVGDLPLVYDFETLNGQPSVKAAGHLLDFIDCYRDIKGHFPFVYTSPGFFSQIITALDTAGRDLVRNCPLWVAHWDVSSPTIPTPWATWAFWQYTDKATVAGVSTPVDMNRANITRTELDALRIR
jgi:GH25 family lysozyme M1 (1,4-beta-N-acetylmuramidase)